MKDLADWQVGAMWEADASRQWEEENKAQDLTEAITHMSYAFDHANSAAEWLKESARNANGSVFEQRILSIFDDLEQLQNDINGLQDRMKQEARKGA